MLERLAWPLVERGLRGWLVGQLPAGIEVVTETTATAPDEYVLLARAGGGPSDDVERRVAVELTVCARTRGRVWTIVREVETAMDLLRANGFEGFYVDDVDVDFDWDDDPLPNQSVRRATSQHTLILRPTRA